MHPNQNFQVTSKPPFNTRLFFFLKLLNRNRPPSIESTGWLSWIKPVLRVKDETLIQQIGCDAVLYIRFVRLLRKLLFCMSAIGLGALVPVYIIATKETG